MTDPVRRFAVGAEPVVGGGTHFRVWAPAREQVWVVERSTNQAQPGRAHPLVKEESGYFSGLVGGMKPGDLYSFRLDRDEHLYPDPVSRFQPEGIHGPSRVVDPSVYHWKDAGFAGTPPRQVIYELHVGTFTREGTYASAIDQLAELRDLGVTTLELMPLADFPGNFGWGYDGVDLFAPTRLYGSPDDLRSFVDAAHHHQLAVIIDVVYNHLGPDGNYLKAFSADYFTDKYLNDWGESLNFDGPNSAGAREFFVENARYWLEEFHFDGLRLDATQSIKDESERHVIADITETAHRVGERLGKRVFVVAENEPQDGRLARPVFQGGLGCDALWNDDFHHSARVALTGHHEAYYSDYRGTAQELISAVKWGYLFQGQHYYWQKDKRGKPSLDLGSRGYVTYLQDHDQVANSVDGQRLDQLAGGPELRAMTTLLLLAPPTPMLFQGQEFNASAPFLYFADHAPELALLVDKGRREFLNQFPSVAARGPGLQLDRSSDPRTFERCKLDFSEREKHREVYALYRDLLALRRHDPGFRQAESDAMHGAVLAPGALLLRFFCEGGDRLLLVNLGAEASLEPAPEPLLAPPANATWKQLLNTEDVKYGGRGFVEPYQEGKWRLAPRSAIVLAAESGPDPIREGDSRANEPQSEEKK